MKFFAKLLIIVVPLITIPTVLLSLSIARNGNIIIRNLVLRNAELELETFRDACRTELETLEKLHIDEMAFYRDSAQNRMIDYVEKEVITSGFLFILEADTGIPIILPEELDSGIISILDEFEPWGWRIGVAVRNSYINAYFTHTIRDSLLTMAGIILLAIVILLLMTRRLVRPIHSLAESAEQMSAGDLRVRVAVSSRDELGTLGRSFNHMADSLQDLTTNLEDQVRDRTDELSKSLVELQSAQDLLVRRERLANLGGVVAGVAHEINTPLGVGVTSASYLKDLLGEVRSKLDTNTLTINDFDGFLTDADKASELLLSNLDRARALVSNFKQLAVDQTVEEQRRFNLNDYTGSIIDGLYPRLKRSSVTVHREIEPEIELFSYPGFYYQIFSNLIINSLIHGYPDGGEGHIHITAFRRNDGIVIEYRDDGVGMDEGLAENVYEPFVTTRAGDGGSGLGLNIVFNLVNRRLNGRISLETSPQKGVRFVIELPID